MYRIYFENNTTGRSRTKLKFILRCKKINWTVTKDNASNDARSQLKTRKGRLKLSGHKPTRHLYLAKLCKPRAYEKHLGVLRSSLKDIQL